MKKLHNYTSSILSINTLSIIKSKFIFRKNSINLTLFLFSIFFSPNLSFSQENQNIEMGKIETKRYTVYKKGYEGFEKATKTWPVEIFKEGGKYPKILIKKVGIIDEFYTADLPSKPAYYFSETEIVITVINKKIYYYTWSQKNGAKIKYILTDGKVKTPIIEEEILTKYRWDIAKTQTGDRAERIESNELAKQKEEEENSLKGKSIKSIKLKLIDNNPDVGLFSMVGIGVEVTLTNGTVLKTKNLGGLTPYTDFEAKEIGGVYAGGDFKVSNSSIDIINDQISLSVWSKYNKSVSGKITQKLNYKSDIYYNFRGRGGKSGYDFGSGRSGTDGGNAINIDVETKNIFINNENIIEVTIYNSSTGALLSVTKVNTKNKVTINIEGGGGGNGSGGSSSSTSGGNGGDGGDGGNVSVTGSASQKLILNVINSGGKGGSGGSGHKDYNSSGTSGRSGKSGRVTKM